MTSYAGLTHQESLMRREINEIPVAIERLLTEGGPAIESVCRAYQSRDIQFLVSVARGSSDHAITYIKYISELVLGLPVASVGPSVLSMYGSSLRAGSALCLSVSQSGQSPDAVCMTQALSESGALTIAITNDAKSPLAASAEVTLELHVGAEQSVAATKTFVASVVQGVWLMAALAKDRELTRALHDLPRQLERAIECDWSSAMDAIDATTGRSLYTLGRGVGLSISDEAALKFKETCLLHAESFSSAEVQHGPMSLIEPNFPVLAFTGRDAAEQDVLQVAERMAGAGATVFVTSERGVAVNCLPRVATSHPLLDPIALISSFYSMVERLAIRLGVNPDAPRNLKKVTHTL